MLMINIFICICILSDMSRHFHLQKENETSYIRFQQMVEHYIYEAFLFWCHRIIS